MTLADTRENELQVRRVAARGDFGKGSFRLEIRDVVAGRNTCENVVPLAGVSANGVTLELVQRAGQHERHRAEGVTIVVRGDDEMPTGQVVSTFRLHLSIVVVEVDDLRIDGL